MTKVSSDTSKGICSATLTVSDTSSYDLVPDGRLYENEFNASTLDCFFQRYIRTSDKEVRNLFRSMMANYLWEAMQKKLQAASTNPTCDKDLDERINYLMDAEFPKRKVRVNALFKWEHEQGSEKTDEPSSHYELEKRTDAFNVSVGSTLKLHPSFMWLFSGQINGVFKKVWQTQLESENLGYQTENSQSFYGAGVNGNLAVKSRDDKKIFEIGGNWIHHFLPPPDFSIRELTGNGSAGLREINFLGRPLSLRASGSFEMKDFTPPPPSSNYFTQKVRRTTANAELTYQSSPKNSGHYALGAVLEYRALLEDLAEHFSMRTSVSHEISALLQLSNQGSNFVRMGLGGGVWGGENQSFGEDVATSLHGGEAHAKASGKLVLVDNLSFDASANIYLKQSDGSIVGWYPAWTSTLALSYDLQKVSTSASANYSGHRISLNENKERHAIDGTLTFKYRPNDRWSLNTQSGTQHRTVKGFEALQSTVLYLGGEISFNPSFCKYLWLSANGGGYVYNYEDASNVSSSGHGWSFAAWASINY